MIEIKREYYPNGNLYWEGEYVNGVLSGYFNVYTNSGNLIAIHFFLDDVEEGEELLIMDLIK
jgi:antitoxin component YwqK of YwqJK toxin-antitoxin module